METIGTILKNKDSKLTKLIDKTQGSENLEAIFHTALEKDLAKNCHFANYKEKLLTVTVANTSWATRFRYAIPDIIKNLKIQPEFKEITNIRYTVSKPTKKAAKKKKNIPSKISKKNELMWKKTLDELKEKTKTT